MASGKKRKYGGLLSCPICAHVLDNYLEYIDFEQSTRLYSPPVKCPLARQLRGEEWIAVAKLSLALCDLHAAFKDQYDFLMHCRHATQNGLRISAFKPLVAPSKTEYIQELKKYVFTRFDTMKKAVHQRLVLDAKVVVQKWSSHVEKVGEECQTKAAKMLEQQKELLVAKQKMLQQELDERRIHFGSSLLNAFDAEPKLQMAREFDKLNALQQEAKGMEASNRREHYDRLSEEKRKRVAWFKTVRQKTLDCQAEKMVRKQERSAMIKDSASEKLQGRLAIAMKKLEVEQVDEWGVVDAHFREHLARVEHYINKIVGHSHDTERAPLYKTPSRVSFKSALAPPLVPVPVIEFASAILAGEMRVLEHKKCASAPQMKKRPQSATLLRAHLGKNYQQRPQTAMPGQRRCDQCSSVFDEGVGLRLERDDTVGEAGAQFRPLCTCCSKSCLEAWNNLYSPPYLRDQRKARIDEM